MACAALVTDADVLREAQVYFLEGFKTGAQLRNRYAPKLVLAAEQQRYYRDGFDAGRKAALTAAAQYQRAMLAELATKKGGGDATG